MCTCILLQHICGFDIPVLFQEGDVIRAVDVVILPDGRMDRKNAALYLGLSVKTLATHAVKGTGPRSIKRGRVFYFKSDLDEWLQEDPLPHSNKPRGLVDPFAICNSASTGDRKSSQRKPPGRYERTERQKR
jgi:predicted DNA-binding transcriptional regulator AlpA